MMQYLLLAAIVAGASALEVTTVTGTTPPPCEAQLDANACNGRPDGNYDFVDKNTNRVLTNFFTQCSNGLAYCQPCWPQSLQFSQRCNQCLYSSTDACYTTVNSPPHTTFTCPDLCPARGPTFRGNIADPGNPFHYIGCWDGLTVGCVVCPAGLKFNEPWNACLYDGVHETAAP